MDKYEIVLVNQINLQYFGLFRLSLLLFVKGLISISEIEGISKSNEYGNLS